MAVAEAGSCSSDLTPSQGTSICHRCGPKKKAKKKKKKKLERISDGCKFSWDFLSRTSDIQDVGQGPAASASLPGNLLKMQILRSHSSPTESESLGVRLRNLCFNNTPGDSDAC